MNGAAFFRPSALVALADACPDCASEAELTELVPASGACASCTTTPARGTASTRRRGPHEPTGGARFFLCAGSLTPPVRPHTRSTRSTRSHAVRERGARFLDGHPP
jgi:hypothetical protein